LAFGQIVSGLDAIVIQKGKEMIALFMEPITHGLFVGFAAAKRRSTLTQLNRGEGEEVPVIARLCVGAPDAGQLKVCGLSSTFCFWSATAACNRAATSHKKPSPFCG
jgi:hypothetical protein